MGSGSGVDRTTVVVRPRKVRKVAIPVAVLLLGVFVLVGAMLKQTDTGVYFRLSDQIAMVVLGLLVGGATLLLTRPRLRADFDGIEVRNVLNSYRYGWNDIVTISFPDGAPWARVELPEDEYVPILAVQAADGTHAVAAMRQLRELRRAVEQN